MNLKDETFYDGGMFKVGLIAREEGEYYVQ